jgi:hypothetical protein
MRLLLYETDSATTKLSAVTHGNFAKPMPVGNGLRSCPDLLLLLVTPALRLGSYKSPGFCHTFYSHEKLTPHSFSVAVKS